MAPAAALAAVAHGHPDHPRSLRGCCRPANRVPWRAWQLRWSARRCGTAAPPFAGRHGWPAGRRRSRGSTAMPGQCFQASGTAPGTKPTHSRSASVRTSTSTASPSSTSGGPAAARHRRRSRQAGRCCVGSLLPASCRCPELRLAATASSMRLGAGRSKPSMMARNSASDLPAMRGLLSFSLPMVVRVRPW